VQDWGEDEERKLVMKLDSRVLLPCCIIYFLAYLDRANMGFVNVLQAGKPSSFEETLHLVGSDFNWVRFNVVENKTYELTSSWQAVSVTYFMVTVLLIPSNLLMKKFSGKRYFPVIMIFWGMIVMCIGAVRNKAGLFAARFFLGVPESGVVPTCIMYFSFWYKPHERAWRIGIFHASNALASGVGGFLAVAIDHVSFIPFGQTGLY
jgi:MFS family permease